jgi:hypothetical protein
MRIHPAIIEQARREREERESEARRIPLHIPAPQPHREQRRPTPEQPAERGVAIIDLTIRL